MGKHLISEKKFSELSEFLKVMNQFDIQAETKVYEDLLFGFCEEKKYEQALFTLYQMKKQDLLLPEGRLKDFFTKLIHAKEYKLAMEVLEEMSNQGVYSSVGLFNPLIKGLCQMDDDSALQQTLFKMSMQNIKPDKETRKILKKYSKLDAIEHPVHAFN